MLRRMTVALAFAVSIALGLAFGPTAAAPVGQASIEVTCTFSNPSYAGDCVERTTRAEKEEPAAACKPILECLNNPQCVKNYCQATTVRRGWSLKKAE